ncbi:hypothetical protein GAMM_60219 [Gammaproteobacteria bacterium]
MNEHSSTLQKQYQLATARVNNMTLRERILLLMALIATIYVLCEMLLMSSMRKAIDTAKIKEAALVEQVMESQQKISSIETQAKNTIPSDVTINSAVAPMFRSLLEKQQGIVLKGLHNFPSQLIDNTTLKLPTPLYRQKVNLVFNGNYLSTYKYLRSVEDLKWMILWDELQYLVTEYPNAEINLTVYTIGSNKEN